MGWQADVAWFYWCLQSGEWFSWTTAVEITKECVSGAAPYSCLVDENIELEKYPITFNWAGSVLHDCIRMLVVLDYIGLGW